MIFNIPEKKEKSKPEKLQVNQILNFLGIHHNTYLRYKRENLIENTDTDTVLNFALQYKHKLQKFKDLPDEDIIQELNNFFFQINNDTNNIEWKHQLDTNFIIESITLAPLFIKKHAKINNITQKELELILILRKYKIFNQELISNLYNSAIAITEKLKEKGLVKSINNNMFMVSKEAELIAQNVVNDLLKRNHDIFKKKTSNKEKLIDLIILLH